jgi:hypothetical protein
MKLAFKLVLVIAVISHSAFAMDVHNECLQKFENLKEEEFSLRKQYAGAGAGAVGMSLGLVETIVLGASGGTIILFAVAAGGAVYLFYKVARQNKSEKEEITKQVDVLYLYQQSKKYRDRSAADSLAGMPRDLEAFSLGFDESARAAIPDKIVTMMETGALCKDGQPISSFDLFNILKSQLVLNPIRTPSGQN